ncbi:MAG: hypothetical protein Q8P97_02440 [bacterium]|nr:hypothetical protein [bacterium]
MRGKSFDVAQGRQAVKVFAYRGYFKHVRDSNMDYVTRKLLGSIVSSENEENWYKPDLFQKNTLSIIPKGIEVLELPPEENRNYNCFIYVLGLQNELEILQETKGFIYNSFIEKLLEKGEFSDVEDPSNGDIIFYRNQDGIITHAGKIIENNFIVSKWSWGPVLRHRVFDVPDFYGNNISYYQGIKHDQAIQLYAKYKEFNVKT